MNADHKPAAPAALPLTWTGQATVAPVVVQTATAELAVFTQPAPDREGVSEDAVAVVAHGEDTVVVAVADGAGGHAHGAAASAIAVEALLEACGSDHVLPVRAAILNGIEAAHAAIRDQSGAGATTLAVIELCAGELRTYHVGDSGIVVCGQRGRLRLRSVFHSPTGYAVEAGLLDAGEALHHEERHVVSNLLGLEPMSVEIGSPITLARRDTAVVASDGLFDNLYAEEIIEHVRRGPLAAACSALAGAALARMHDATRGTPSKPDDLSIVLLRRRA